MSLASYNNIRTLRKEAREMDFQTFNEIVEKLLQIQSELEDLQKEEVAKQAKKNELMARIREMLEAEGIEGISITDSGEGVPVSSASPNKGSGRGGKGVKRGKAEAKYAFKDDNGDEKTWTGRGRMPKPLEFKIKAGQKIEDFLINKEDK